MDIWNWISGTFYDLLCSLGLLYKTGNLVLIGLDNAGKTTLMGVLKNNLLKQNPPTTHPTKEEILVGNIKFACFDIGGHAEARHLWKQYFPSVSAIVYLIDASDRDRLLESKEALDSVLSNDNIKDVPILILGNKIDRRTALSEDELRNELGLPSTVTTGKAANASTLKSQGIRPIEVFMCSVISRQGYKEGFQWISQFID